MMSHEPGQPVSPGIAVFLFASWLTLREEVAGPFSRYHNTAADLARLAGDYCRLQGWEIDDNVLRASIIAEVKEIQEREEQEAWRGGESHE